MPGLPIALLRKMQFANLKRGKAADIGRFLVGATVHAAGETLALRADVPTEHNLPQMAKARFPKLEISQMSLAQELSQTRLS